MSLAVAVLPAYLRTPLQAVWLGRGVDALGPCRLWPQRLAPVLFLVKHPARREYRRGQRAPERWRDPPAPFRRDLGAP